MAGVLDQLIHTTRTPVEQCGKGVVMHTPQEIRRQAELWPDTAQLMARNLPEILDQLCHMRHEDASDGAMAARSIVLSGAGSSHHVGMSLEPFLRKRLQVEARAVASTDIVLDPSVTCLKDHPYLVVLFARSGDSPESLGAIDAVRSVCPNARFLAITCNEHGGLATAAREGAFDGAVTAVVLDERTNDKGLAMTSSFTNMVVAGQALGLVEDMDEYLSTVDLLAAAGERAVTKLADAVKDVADRSFARALFLGSGALYGAARESALKLQELTDGAVVTQSETFLGVRHGPEAVVNEETLVVYFVSGDEYRRRYELDLINEVHAKQPRALKLAVAPRASRDLAGIVDVCVELAPTSPFVHDDLRPPVDAVIAQLIALFKSVSLGMEPDNPSRRGMISRVVEGVTYYPLSGNRQDD
jgi:tagatose-6-phosphate ketose/aldose isomerase